jgi:uncharacterized protein with GYD domain
MDTFFLFGKYATSSSIQQISSARTQKARETIEKCGGVLKGCYALLGEYDLVLIVELPRMADAMRASIALTRLTGIAFSTAAAVPVEDFDKLADES